MKKESPHTKSDEPAQAEPQGERQAQGWRPILAGATRELSARSWLQNFVIGLVFVLVAPVIGGFMQSRKATIIGFGIGLTILIWIVVIILIKQDSPGPEPVKQTPSPSPEQPASTPSPTPQRGSTATTHINGYKLFYFRVNHKLSFNALARATDLKPAFLRKLEKIKPRQGNLDPSQWFAECDRNVLNLLEDALGAHGRLEAGKPDDFLTQYMVFYDTNKKTRSSPQRDGDQLELRFQTRAVVFDFDGTLTHPGDYATTWEKIWVALGYPKEMCFDLHTRFQRKEFDHTEWCNQTLAAFKARQLNREQMVEIARDISLVDGVAETVAELRHHGLKLFILSGSIKSIIRLVLGEMYHEFEEIKANDLVFDSSGLIAKIDETLYDFEGKALFIKRIIQDYGLSPSDILFVGNDCNDIFASQSGARTLCVNARLTDPANKAHWTYAIGEMFNLSQILEYVRL